MNHRWVHMESTGGTVSWQKVHTCPCNLRPGAILVPEVGLLPEIVSRAMPSKHIVRTLLHTRGGAIVSYHHLQQPSLKHMPGDFTSQPTSVVRVSKVHMAFEHKGRVYIMMERIHGTPRRCGPVFHPSSALTIAGAFTHRSPIPQRCVSCPASASRTLPLAIRC